MKSVEEFKNEALEHLKKTQPERIGQVIFGYNGEGDLRSREVLNHIFLKQRIIHDIDPSTETEILGYKLKTPIMVAPMASMATMFDDGIGKMCAATKETGSMTWIAFYSKEYYGKHVKTTPLVFIMKPTADREKLVNELKTAEQEGCVATGIDVDSGGDRPYRWGVLKPLGVDELKKVKKHLSKPFIIKGILSVEDAVAAVEVGADAIVVSNHYGMKLDYTQAPLEVLPSILKAIGEKVEVLVDCQMRKGSDVLKALAMGARGVLVGRPIVWAAYVGETEGMTQLIRVMTEELKKAMLYTGVESVREVSKNILVLPKYLY